MNLAEQRDYVELHDKAAWHKIIYESAHLSVDDQRAALNAAVAKIAIAQHEAAKAAQSNNDAKAFEASLKRAARQMGIKPKLQPREAVLTELCVQLGEDYSWDKVERSVDGYPLYRLNCGADWPMGSLRRSYPQFLKALQQFAQSKGLS